MIPTPTWVVNSVSDGKFGYDSLAEWIAQCSLIRQLIEKSSIPLKDVLMTAVSLILRIPLVKLLRSSWKSNSTSRRDQSDPGVCQCRTCQRQKSLKKLRRETAVLQGLSVTRQNIRGPIIQIVVLRCRQNFFQLPVLPFTPHI
jgi:hypothetical protein